MKNPDEPRFPARLPEDPSDVRGVEHPTEGELSRKEVKFFSKNVGAINHLDVYEVTPEELSALTKRGNNYSIYLGFALTLLVTSLTALLSLLTLPTPSSEKLMIFVTSILVTGILGLLILGIGIKEWWGQRRATNQLLENIKSRLEE